MEERFSIEEGAKLLRVVFPNYPELQPCHPAPRDLREYLRWLRNKQK